MGDFPVTGASEIAGESPFDDDGLLLLSDEEVGFSADSERAKMDPWQIARKYQLELAEKAFQENSVVVLETGCGKTLIAVLLLCKMGPLIKKPQKNICVFLAPTVVLVRQQAGVIQEFTDFRVGINCGDAKHLKSHSDWEKELEQYEVLVMTPQILLGCLLHCFIRMEMISLLIFDECHYAQLDSNHPYAEIMKLFYTAKAARLPRIFGMTASPISGKGASIHSLETLLHAKICLVDNINREELENVIVSPKVKVYHYASSTDISSNSNQIYLEKLVEIKRQCISMLRRTEDNHTSIKNSKRLLHKWHNDLVCCLGSLGLRGALQASRIISNGEHSEQIESAEAKGTSSDDVICPQYLAQAVSALDFDCMKGVVDGISSDFSPGKVLKEPFFSQKVLCLIEILSNFRSRPSMKCIIFVNRILIARSLSYILGQLPTLSSWKCDFLVGVHSGVKNVSRKTMNDTLEQFRSGKLNLLVATKVAEEGLDIQTCCLVIRFDLPENLTSFIQSRGRARMPQSEYAFLVDSTNEKEVNLMESFKKSERLMNKEIVCPKSHVTTVNLGEEVYEVDTTGATISSQTSISLLHHYCSTLPHDEYFNPKPDFSYVDDVEGTVCHIIFPANAPIHHIASTAQSSMEAAKRDACLKACKELHKLGALTDYLLPLQADDKEESILDLSDSDSEDERPAGELYEMLVPAALKEPWSDLENPVCLQSYFIKFTPKPHDRQYREFGFFVKAPLPGEAERLKVDLHLAHGRSVITDFIPCGVAEFDKEEIRLAENFQEMFLKIILDRSKFVPKHVVLKKNGACELKSSTMYLLLPVTWHENASSMCIDWETIRRCLSSPIFTCPMGRSDRPVPQSGHLQLADGPTSVSDIVNSLVYHPYKNSFFFVTEILPDKNAYDMFNASSTHVEHLNLTFGVHPAYPQQPLLKVKQLFNLDNLLHDRKRGNSEPGEKEEVFFELPPEIFQLKIIGFSKDIGSSLSLLPSVMQHLENLLVAIELKERFSKSFMEGTTVTAERVLEALTTEKSHVHFSLERLEVLGDAFLKFAVGRHLFLAHEAMDEGQLTRKRCSIVSNSNLWKLAINQKLQVYIRDQEFDPHQFFALGRPCSCATQTETSIDSQHGNSSENYCSKHHNVLYKKTIADVVEALVGAFIVDSGFKAATAFLRWIGIRVKFEISDVYRSWAASTRFNSLADRIDVSALECSLGYRFLHRGLLVQAFVHASYNQLGGCYQRLEFLGDAILDYLITSYLYSVYPDLKPGQLTDLRSLLVSNVSFARVAVDHSLHKFIISNSKPLSDDIEKYAKYIGGMASEKDVLQEPKCPKALGDLVESSIGAILLDMGFDLNCVWKIVLSFLDPTVSFPKMQLNPLRELRELCQAHGWDLKFPFLKRNKLFLVEAKVSGPSVSVTTRGFNINKKAAKSVAAEKAYAILKDKGYRARTISLEEVLKTTRKMAPKLIGYDEMPIPVVFSDAFNFENLSSEETTASNSYLLPVDALNFENLKLEDLSSSSSNPIPFDALDSENLRFEDPPTSNSNLVSVNSHNFNNLRLEDPPTVSSSIPVPHLLDQRPTPTGMYGMNQFSMDQPSTNVPKLQIPFRKPASSSSPALRLKHSEPTWDSHRNIDLTTGSAPGRKTSKQRLHEICVANCWSPPSFECCKDEGPSHLRLFTYKVVILIEEAKESIECYGEPHARKKAAAERAAEAAIWFLEKEGYIQR